MTITKEEYLLKMAPDMSVFDMAEQMFATGKIPYINDMNCYYNGLFFVKDFILKNNNTISSQTTNIYRGMFISDNPDFSVPNDRYHDTVKLSYKGLTVFICEKNNRIDNTQSGIVVTVKKKNQNSNTEEKYRVIGVAF